MTNMASNYGAFTLDVKSVLNENLGPRWHPMLNGP
jgi:hypothetical protein